jgi:hypothetical protein
LKVTYRFKRIGYFSAYYRFPADRLPSHQLIIARAISLNLISPIYWTQGNEIRGDAISGKNNSGKRVFGEMCFRGNGPRGNEIRGIVPRRIVRLPKLLGISVNSHRWSPVYFSETSVSKYNNSKYLRKIYQEICSFLCISHL